MWRLKWYFIYIFLQCSQLVTGRIYLSILGNFGSDMKYQTCLVADRHPSLCLCVRTFSHRMCHEPSWKIVILHTLNEKTSMKHDSHINGFSVTSPHEVINYLCGPSGIIINKSTYHIKSYKKKMPINPAPKQSRHHVLKFKFKSNPVISVC